MLNLHSLQHSFRDPRTTCKGVVVNDVAAVNIDSKLVPCAALDIGLESKKCLAGLTLAFDGQTVLVAMIWFFQRLLG